jgi:hypothetical protein
MKEKEYLSCTLAVYGGICLLLVHSKTSFQLHKLHSQEKDYLGIVNFTGCVGSAFDTRAVHVGFVVDRVTMGQVCPV